jgi:Zn-dependent protease with chaperone function
MAQASSGNAPPAFLSTHPSDEKRIGELRGLIPTVAPLYNGAPKG